MTYRMAALSLAYALVSCASPTVRELHPTGRIYEPASTVPVLDCWPIKNYEEIGRMKVDATEIAIDGARDWAKTLHAEAIVLIRDCSHEISSNAAACKTAFESKDFGLAAEVCLPEAERGDPEAQYVAGQLYDGGFGVQPDYGQALKWYRKTADQGLAEVQYRVGYWYSEGKGAPRDLVDAYKWFRLAAAGLASAKGNRDLAAGQMTSEELARAKDLVRQWRPTSRPPFPPVDSGAKPDEIEVVAIKLLG
jgi:TPR repeat protein